MTQIHCHLPMADRRAIAQLLSARTPVRLIAKGVGRQVSTIYLELTATSSSTMIASTVGIYQLPRLEAVTNVLKRTRWKWLGTARRHEVLPS